MKKNKAVFVFAAVGIVLVVVSVAISGRPSSPAAIELSQHQADAADAVAKAAPIPTRPAVPTRFVDIASSAGLNYTWTLPGQTPRSLLQTIGNGCAFLDYDHDGNLDILLVGSHVALYRGDGRGHFADVSAQTGIGNLHGYFLGCAVGDYDNDGYPDIFLTGYHTAALLHNEQGRSFRDVTQEAGIDTSTWSTSAAWADVENDGRLDLYICNYCKFTPQDPQICEYFGIKSACKPASYDSDHGRLYRNLGHGEFVDATRQWKLDSVTGKDLGAAFADYDSSGHQSLFVANDQVASNLFHNEGREFEDDAIAAGTATTEQGKPYAGMGVDWGDYDNDGKLDVAVMDYWNEDKRILHNDGDSLFSNKYNPLGFAIGGFPRVAFGVKWFDYDNDGWLDLIDTNGYTADNIADITPSFTFAQPTLLYHNGGGKHFDNVSAGLGDGMRPIVGRGLAIGDFDNDGRVDALVVDSAGKPLLLHNETPGVGNWLELSLVGTRSNRDGFGAKVIFEAGPRKLLRICHSDGSYMSSSDPRVHVGLGSATRCDRITILWPSGSKDVLTNVDANRIVTVTEGETHKDTH